MIKINHILRENQKKGSLKMNPQNQPINLIIQSAKAEIFQSVNSIMTKYKLPGFLADGIISSLLASVREMENTEMLRTIQPPQMNDKEQKDNG